jgi:hypothetical protein
MPDSIDSPEPGPCLNATFPDRHFERRWCAVHTLPDPSTHLPIYGTPCVLGFLLDGRRRRGMIYAQHNRRERMNIKQPQPDATTRRIPVSGRDGRDWGLGIGDCRTGVRDTRCRMRDTRPACGRCAKQSQLARPGAAIGDCGFGTGESGEAETDDLSAPRKTKPITLYVVVLVLPGHYMCKVGSRERKTKPIGRVRAKPANPKPEARNKPKIPRIQGSGPEARRPCGHNVKQTQFAPFLGQKRGWAKKHSQSAWPGGAIGDCGFGIGDSRAVGAARL